MEIGAVRSAIRRLGGGRPASELEDPTLEFKAVTNSVKVTLGSVADALVCFMNAEGGSVVLGVDDKAC